MYHINKRNDAYYGHRCRHYSKTTGAELVPFAFPSSRLARRFSRYHPRRADVSQPGVHPLRRHRRGRLHPCGRGRRGVRHRGRVRQLLHLIEEAHD